MQGKAVAVLASGPSLTPEDVATVREAGLIIVAVNTTWEMAPFCDAIYAGDHVWWKRNAHKITSKAKRFSRSSNAEKQFGARYCKTKLGRAYNSGMLAVEFALLRGAETVVMLGFDCSVKNGIHHHGRHDKTPNPNPRKCELWRVQFAHMAKYYKGRRVINCSRYTELDCFPRRELGGTIASLPKSAIHRPPTGKGV